MKLDMEQMVNELEKTQSVEAMVGLENKIAKDLGDGFLQGKIDYSFLNQIKENVEYVEAKQRNAFEPVETLPKRALHTR